MKIWRKTLHKVCAKNGYATQFTLQTNYAWQTPKIEAVFNHKKLPVYMFVFDIFYVIVQ